MTSVQFSSVAQLCLTLCDPMNATHQASLSITNSRSLLKPMSIESVMPSGHIILCRPLLLLPPIPLSIRVLSNESTFRMIWPKYWSFSFSISPSNEHPGLISFRMDWLDLLAVQWTPKSLLQHHSSKASILWHSAFFTVQLSHPYMTTGKTIALTRRTFSEIFSFLNLSVLLENSYLRFYPIRTSNSLFLHSLLEGSNWLFSPSFSFCELWVPFFHISYIDSYYGYPSPVPLTFLLFLSFPIVNSVSDISASPWSYPLNIMDIWRADFIWSLNQQWFSSTLCYITMHM